MNVSNGQVQFILLLCMNTMVHGILWVKFSICIIPGRYPQCKTFFKNTLKTRVYTVASVYEGNEPNSKGEYSVQPRFETGYGKVVASVHTHPSNSFTEEFSKGDHDFTDRICMYGTKYEDFEKQNTIRAMPEYYLYLFYYDPHTHDYTFTTYSPYASPRDIDVELFSSASD